METHFEYSHLTGDPFIMAKIYKYFFSLHLDWTLSDIFY